MRSYSPGAWLLIALVVYGCGSDEPGNGPAQPVEWTLAGEPATLIGAMEGAEEYLFHEVADAAFLPDGRIAIADRGLGVIRVYGAGGSFETEMGGMGDGPGEFRYIAAISIQPPDTIIAYDGRAQRLNVFLDDGTLVETVGVTAEDGWPELFLGRFTGGDLALAWIRPGPRSPDRVAPDAMEMARYSPAGSIRTRLASTTGIRRLGGGPVPFSPFFHGQVFGDSLYFTDGMRAEVSVVDGDGNTVRVVETPRSDIAPEAARRALEAEFDERGAEDQRERLAQVPPQDSVPQVADMLLDDQGNIWGKRYDPRQDALWLGGGTRGRGGDWWVIRGDGEVVATIALPDELVPLEVEGGRLLGKTRDDLGIEQVAVFDISRP